MSGIVARVALVVGSLGAAGAGWFSAGRLHDGDSGTARGEVSIYDCPTPGGAAIGVVGASDALQLVGVTDDRWAVIQRPDSPDQLAWIPVAFVDTDADAGDLPQITCGDAATAIATTIVDVTTTTQPASTTSSPTTSSSTTTSTTTTSSTTTSIATSSTVSTDVTPPTVTLTANRAFFYVSPVSATCVGQDQLDITVVVTDPTSPRSVRSIQAAWTGPSGAQTANLTPIGGNRFRLQITTNGPDSGELPVTITGTGSDGAGNVGTGELIVPLRQPTSFGCN